LEKNRNVPISASVTAFLSFMLYILAPGAIQFTNNATFFYHPNIFQRNLSGNRIKPLLPPDFYAFVWPEPSAQKKGTIRIVPL
ncbi:MAG TPA: hypothetical protein VF145_12985, partial [Chitinophagaceae bacterium]